MKAERTNRTAADGTRTTLIQTGLSEPLDRKVELSFDRERWSDIIPEDTGRKGCVPILPIRCAGLGKVVAEWSPSFTKKLVPRLIPRVMVKVLIGPAGIWAKCYRIAPISKFTKKHRSSTTAIDRTCDVVFPETTSFPLKERLALHGARDRTLSAPRVADDDVGRNVVELSDREMEDLGPQGYAWKGSRPVFAKSNGLQDVLMTHPDVEHSRPHTGLD